MEETFAKLCADLIRHVTVKELHRRTKVGVQTWRDWANGKLPSQRLVNQAAAGLGVSAAQLLGYEPLPYGFLEHIAGAAGGQSRAAAVRRIQHELRAIEEHRQKLLAELERLLEPEPAPPEPPHQDAA